MKQTQKAYPCQSLGNKFILLDWLGKTPDQIQKELFDEYWCQKVRQWCQRESTDGVLVVISSFEADAECRMFNVDGSKAEKCLNGVRCAAHFLVHQKGFPERFSMMMTHQRIPCEVRGGKIQIKIDSVNVIGDCNLQVNDAVIEGYQVDVGNPHFVVLQKVTREWLAQYGHAIETHERFPKHTNVEFVWYDEAASTKIKMPVYQILVYERGCGITLACGSGAAAVIKLLHHLKKITTDQPIVLSMSGGHLTSFIDQYDCIVQSTAARDTICKMPFTVTEELSC